MTKKLSLDESQPAKAVYRPREATWRENNKAALSAHNARVEKDGGLLLPEWTEDK